MLIQYNQNEIIDGKTMNIIARFTIYFMMDSYRSEEVNNMDFEKCKEISHIVQKNVEEILPKLKKKN